MENKGLSDIEISLLRRAEEVIKETFEKQKTDKKDVSSKKQPQK